MNRPPFLPFAPRPLEDELLLSWLCRLAASNYLTFDQLCPELRTMSRYQLNFDPGADVLERVARMARLNPEKLTPLLLRNRFPLLSTVNFLLPPTAPVRPINDPPDMSLLLPFCPQCAGEAEKAQFNLHWETEWGLPTAILCPRHGIPPDYVCPLCHHFVLTLVWHEDRAALRCAKCTWRPAALPAESSRPAGAMFLLVRLQRDLAAALRGDPPSDFWFGYISPDQFLAVIGDLYWLLRTHGLAANSHSNFTFADLFFWIGALETRSALLCRVRDAPFRCWRIECKAEILIAIASRLQPPCWVCGPSPFSEGHLISLPCQ